MNTALYCTSTAPTDTYYTHTNLGKAGELRPSLRPRSAAGRRPSKMKDGPRSALWPGAAVRSGDGDRFRRGLLDAQRERAGHRRGAREETAPAAGHGSDDAGPGLRARLGPRDAGVVGPGEGTAGAGGAVARDAARLGPRGRGARDGAAEDGAAPAAPLVRGLRRVDAPAPAAPARGGFGCEGGPPGAVESRGGAGLARGSGCARAARVPRRLLRDARRRAAAESGDRAATIRAAEEVSPVAN